MRNFINELGGRKVLCGIFIFLAVWANQYYGLNMDVKQLMIGISGFLAFIGVEGVRDIVQTLFDKGFVSDAKELLNAVNDDGEGDDDKDDS